MNRMLVLLLFMSIGINLIACGTGGRTDTSSTETTSTESAEAATTENVAAANTEITESAEEADSTTNAYSSLEAAGNIDVDENLLSVTVTLPAGYTDPEMTQDDYDAAAKEADGIKSATLNEDGSVTYVMTKARHRQMLQELEEQYAALNNDMIGSEDFPNITDIKANDDFTEFTVTTTSTELSLMESMSVLQFYMEGGMYGIMSGKIVDNVHVDYVNAETGEIIDTADSSDLGE